MVLRAVLWMGGGALLGWFVLFSQAATVAHLRPQAGRRLLWHFAGGFIFRLSVVGGGLWWALQQGLAPALWLLGGFWLMRWFLIQRIHTGRVFQRQLRARARSRFHGGGYGRRTPSSH